MPKVERYSVKPTFVVDSGNGIQLLWRLKRPLKINGSGEIADAELRNKALAEAFGASPATRNIDRLLRLPGTVNHPNAKKRRLGRVECTAKVIAYHDNDYAPSHFSTETEKPEKDKSASGQFHRIVCGLFERGWPIGRIERDIKQRPKRYAATSAARYDGEGRLREEIERCYNKWLKDNPDTDHRDEPGGPPIVSSSEFVAGFVPADYLVDGLLQRGFLYSLTGKTGSGKTAILLLFSAMVGGLEGSIGDHAVERGRVLYLAGENPDDVRMRWIAMLDGIGVEPSELDVHFMVGRTSLSKDIDRIRERITKLGGVQLVIIDTVRAYFEDDNENDNVQMGNFARQLREELTTLPGKPCVVAAAHPTKNASEDNLAPAGGGAFVNEVDGNLTCVRNDKTVTLHWQVKFRGSEFYPIRFVLAEVYSPRLKDSKGRMIKTVTARSLSESSYEQRKQVACSVEDEVMRFMLDHPGESIAKTAEGLGLFIASGTHKGDPNKAHVWRVMKRLNEHKLVKQGRGEQWELTEKGVKAAKNVLLEESEK